MDKFRERFRKFMIGRYGMDQLGRFLTGAVLALCVVRIFLPFFLLRRITGILIWAGVIIFYLRFFSRDIGKRYKENEVYLRYQFYVTEKWRKWRFQFEERRKYHIFRCPGCGQKVRIPRGRGRVSIHCPKCGRDFIKKS